MTSPLDAGLAGGNYFDYADDDVAAQREYEIMESLPEYYVDPCFPPDARSLYFDPYHPPKGASPGSSFVWSRISKKEVLECDEPVFCLKNAGSSKILQGALGNSYFVNALRLLAAGANGQQITRLLVSDKYALQGMYTFKFFKAGRWRYVHVDDLIPCRQSGRVNFCRNCAPNETFAMLLEKAYAKLHGCYEAIVNGLIEKALLDLTPGGHTAVLRNERLDLDTVCDKTWEFVQGGLARQHLLCCGKFLPDPYAEKLASRQGISAGVLYQVMDCIAVTAAPTAELDTLTVGMVCVRNLQPDEGRFVGRWSFGHALWQQYKDIGLRLRHRTRELQFRRGLGLDPNATDPETKELINFIVDDTKSLKLHDAEQKLLKLESERDGLSIDYLGRTRFPPPQPEEKDLYWVQIEDFVEVFNRVYDLADLSIAQGPNMLAGYRKYFSKWIPGDFVAGSGGPPCLLKGQARAREREEAEPEINETIRLFQEAEAEGGAAGGGMSEGPPPAPAAAGGGGASEGVAEGGGAAGGGSAATAPEAGGGVAEEKEAKPEADTPAAPAKEGGEEGQGESKEGGEHKSPTDDVDGSSGVHTLDPAGQPSADPDTEVYPDPTSDAAADPRPHGQDEPHYGPIAVAAIPVSALYDDEEDIEAEVVEEEEETWEPMRINDDFTDNPMYPFSVSEPAQICFALYQPDRRWSVARLGEDPRDITASEFASRGQRLAACMQYPRALGFLVVRLSGSKVRLTDFKLRKIVARSDEIAYSNAASCCALLRPGRYAVIPFTDEVVPSSEAYILHAQFIAKQVEFEVSDLLEERPMDQDISDDESGQGDEEEEDDDEDEDRRPEAVAARALQRERARLERKKARFEALQCKPPERVLVPPWEYVEDSENMATVSVFDEVGDLSRHLMSLRQDVRELKQTAKEIQDLMDLRTKQAAAAAKQRQADEAAAAAREATLKAGGGGRKQSSARTISPPKK